MNAKMNCIKYVFLICAHAFKCSIEKCDSVYYNSGYIKLTQDMKTKYTVYTVQYVILQYT